MLATKSNSYTFQKSGVWYFSRRVPADLRRHYRTNRIAFTWIDGFGLVSKKHQDAFRDQLPLLPAVRKYHR